MASSTIPNTSGPSITPATVKPANEWHTLFVKIVAETIGVVLLAIFADMDEHLGQVLMVLMIGWFVIFLMINASNLPLKIP